MNIKPFVLLLFCAACFGQAVTVTPATTYQTHGHVAVAPYARSAPNGVIIDDSLWTNVRPQFIAQLVNQLGIDTLSFWVSGFSPPTYNSIAVTTFLNAYWPTFSAAVQANGKTPYIMLVYDTTGPVASATYVANAENMFTTLSGAGYTVNFFSAENEPDFQSWTTTSLGNDLLAAVTALNGLGYFPTIVCCDTENYGTAVSWYTAVKAIVGTGVIGVISSHNYSAGNTTGMAAVATQAASDGIQSWMTEYFMTTALDIIQLLTYGNVSGYMRGLDARSAVTATAPPGDACSYLSVNSESPSYQSTYNLGTEAPPTSYYACQNTEPTYFHAQFFSYVRQGAMREAASITGGSSNWNTVAYIGPGNTGHVVIIQSMVTGSKTVTVTGVPAGTYACTWTTGNSSLLQSCAANQTITTGGTLTATQTIPSPLSNSQTTAVFTFFDIRNNPNAQGRGTGGPGMGMGGGVK